MSFVQPTSFVRTRPKDIRNKCTETDIVMEKQKEEENSEFFKQLQSGIIYLK